MSSVAPEEDGLETVEGIVDGTVDGHASPGLVSVS